MHIVKVATCNNWTPHFSVIFVNADEAGYTLYLAIVRPHLGYATQVWSPQSIDLIRRVERVQRRATKVILNLPFKTDNP
jgi:hypothetical protein